MFTADQILALSPDDSSAKAAKGLLAPAKWPLLGHDEVAIWGECQGSGSKPYQVIIEVSGPSFKCSCPSRKFPCKHGLALYLLLAQKQSAFTANTQPQWVNEWLSARQERAEKKAEKAAQTESKPADPEAAAKREAKRLDRMIAGAQDLELWMADLVNHGLADLPAKPVTFWRDAAARLVDAQASGLAAGVRQLESAVSSGEGWQQRTVVSMGRLQLLTEAMQRLESLPDLLQHDVRSSAGWAMDKEDVLAANDRVADAWHVLGISHDENEKLWERRVWLRGAASGRNALLLDFSHGGRRFDQVFVPGTVVKATLCFFPSASPLRALWIDEPQSAPRTQSSAENEESKETPLRTSALSATSAVNSNWDAALESIAEALAGQPWFQRLPLMLRHAVPVFRDLRWYLRDAEGREVQMRMSMDDGWQLGALSGGHPLAVFGEWLGERLRPLSAWRGESTQPCWTEVTSLA
ncbi:MAG: SWIM zinc finger family protein [Verrucomicrobiaceae bacterium]